MKDPLEEALERMKPAELPNELMARLTAARPQPQEAKPAAPGWSSLFRRWLIPLGAGACAAMAAVALMRETDPAGPKTPVVQNRAGTPYERNDFLVGWRDGGVMVAPDHKPYRIMEVEWSEEDTMRTKPDGSAFKVETKRRAVVPVPLEVF